MGVMSYSDTVNNYSQYALSVLHVGDTSEFELKKEYNPHTAGLEYESNEESVLVKNESDVSVNFELEKGESGFAEAADEGINPMNIVLYDEKQAVELKSLKLKMKGETSIVNKAYLRVDGEKLFEGKVNGEYVEFGKIAYVVEPGNKVTFRLVVDLNGELKISDRVNFSVEKAEDVVVEIAKEKTKLNGYYPIKGESLTVISKPRQQIEHPLL